MDNKKVQIDKNCILVLMAMNWKPIIRLDIKKLLKIKANGDIADAFLYIFCLSIIRLSMISDLNTMLSFFKVPNCFSGILVNSKFLQEVSCHSGHES